jgi:hypothetical protein
MREVIKDKLAQLRTRAARLRRSVSRHRSIAWLGASVVSVLIIGVTIVLVGTQSRDQASALSVNLGTRFYQTEGNGLVKGGTMWHMYPCSTSSQMYGGGTFAWMGDHELNNEANATDGDPNTVSGRSSCWQILDHGIPNTDVVVHCNDPDKPAPGDSGQAVNLSFATSGDGRPPSDYSGGTVWDQPPQPTFPASQRVSVHVRVRSFRPAGISSVSTVKVNPGTEIIDNITPTTGHGTWPTGTAVKYCVRAYGPYSTPQTSQTWTSSGVANEQCTGDGGQPSHPTGPGSSFGMRFTALTKPGHYYFQIYVPNDGQPNFGQLEGLPWSAAFDDVNEHALVRFQPYFSSKVSQTFIDDLGAKQVVDRISSHAADSLAKANANADDDGDGYGGVDSYWLDNTPVKVCVKAWGPYHQAQPTDYNNGVRIDSHDKVPDGISPKAPKATVCSDGTSSGTGGGVNGGDFTGARQIKDFVFDTSSWTPGYYYFTEHMIYNDQTSATRDIIIGDWHSTFNPKLEDEATIEKFQIKPTSQTVAPSGAGGTTIRTDIIGDANHNGQNEGLGEPTKNSQHTDWDRDAIPVLKPSDKYIEDSFDIRAYDTNSPDDTTANAKPEYWLKDLNGNFITFRVCATVYGPYQQPQGAGISNPNGTSSPRLPSAGIGQASDPLPDIPNNYLGNKDGRQQCFWTNDATTSTATSGLVAKPSTGGGPGRYTVRWDNQADNYFQPGYYYVVWNVDAAHNDQDTTVNIGEGNAITQKNGQFLESNWWSPFGEQTESFYSQFQPIAKSDITETSSSDKVSQRKKSVANGGNGGAVLECDENKYSNLVNFVDNPEEFPHQKLHCHSVSDQISLGAVNDKAIDRTNHEVADQDNNNSYWPKNKDSQWEVLKFQVKLYGPFKYPYARTPSDANKAGWAGDNLVTVVPKNTDGKDIETAQGILSQPIAKSCVITTAGNDGPTTTYDAVFTQDPSSCAGSGFPSSTEIELTPGFYVSVVEILRDGIANPDATQITTRPHNMIIEDRFTSAWGDRAETLLVPIPLYIITRRDNSAQDTFVDQVTINDQYWVAGFSGEYVGDDGNKHRWTDLWGDEIPLYGTYSGKEGYVMDGTLPGNYKYSYSSSGVEDYYQNDIAGDIHVRLYGAYPLENGRPNEGDEYCAADKLVKRGTWQLPAVDTPLGGKDLPYPAPLTLTEKGWYVFQYTFNGGDRMANIKTQCGDTHEMFRIVKDDIGLVTTANADNKTAPTRITDTVQVTGSFKESDKNSIVKLSLYKRLGQVNSPGLTHGDGAPLCTVIFTVSAAGTYSTIDYIDAQGYVLAGNPGSGRCYAETGGHHYWIEEFLRPGSNPLDPTPSDHIQPPGKGDAPENIDINPPPTPEVTTDADPTTSVNRPFRDTALVTNIPEGNTKVYKLWFTAYGPFADGRVDCSSQLIYSNQSSPITVTKNGRYESDYITVSTNGVVYWVEHLEDENGTIVDQGECGARRENTYVIGPDVPNVPGSFTPFQVTPRYPDAGYISQQFGKVIALGIVSMLGAWQLTSKNSWLLRKR